MEGFGGDRRVRPRATSAIPRHGRVWCTWEWPGVLHASSNVWVEEIWRARVGGGRNFSPVIGCSRGSACRVDGIDCARSAIEVPFALTVSISTCARTVLNPGLGSDRGLNCSSECDVTTGGAAVPGFGLKKKGHWPLDRGRVARIRIRSAA